MHIRTQHDRLYFGNKNQGNILFTIYGLFASFGVRYTPKDECEVKTNIIFGNSMIDYPLDMKIKEIYYFSI
jgi:hypothetical protein